MLKKSHNPTVKIICPNCGSVCATTDVLCPNCGKNLDELFEQLPVSQTSSFTHSKWLTVFWQARPSKMWRVLNSFILIITLIVPWKVVYNDWDPFTITGLKVLLNSIANDLPYIFYFNCHPCVSRGLIVIGHLTLMLYAILNLVQASLHDESRYQNLRKALKFCIAISCLLFLQIVTPLLSTPPWGYWLACAGLLSSLWLEAAELRSNKSYVRQLLQKAA